MRFHVETRSPQRAADDVAKGRIVFDHDDGREGTSYGVRLRLGHRLAPTLELGFREVADNRGTLAWCATLAEHVKRLAREFIADGAVADASPR